MAWWDELKWKMLLFYGFLWLLINYYVKIFLVCAEVDTKKIVIKQHEKIPQIKIELMSFSIEQGKLDY